MFGNELLGEIPDPMCSQKTVGIFNGHRKQVIRCQEPVVFSVDIEGESERLNLCQKCLDGAKRGLYGKEIQKIVSPEIIGYDKGVKDESRSLIIENFGQGPKIKKIL